MITEEGEVGGHAEDPKLAKTWKLLKLSAKYMGVSVLLKI